MVEAAKKKTTPDPKPKKAEPAKKKPEANAAQKNKK